MERWGGLKDYPPVAISRASVGLEDCPTHRVMRRFAEAERGGEHSDADPRRGARGEAKRARRSIVFGPVPHREVPETTRPGRRGLVLSGHGWSKAKWKCPKCQQEVKRNRCGCVEVTHTTPGDEMMYQQRMREELAEIKPHARQMNL